MHSNDYVLKGICNHLKQTTGSVGFFFSKVLAGPNYKMMGGSETVSGDKDGVHITAIHVPIGWQRRVEGGQVIYVRWVGSFEQKAYASDVDLILEGYYLER